MLRGVPAAEKGLNFNTRPYYGEHPLIIFKSSFLDKPKDRTEKLGQSQTFMNLGTQIAKIRVNN